ncbi:MULTISPECIES: porin family protein [Vibrio]|uniref:porin family protein n=1 Tax=Vibrio TaxID=662 RepID=UPI003D13EB7D
MTFSKFILPTIFAFSAAAPAFASNSTDVSGHRVGLGYSNTDLVIDNSGLDWGDGIKLEYGYDINRIVGINASYQNNNGKTGNLEIDGSNYKIDTDLGYMFTLDGWAIKPYGAVGLIRANETQTRSNGKTFSNKETSLMGGFGVRANIDMGLYTDLRYDFYNVNNLNTDQLSLTVGYKF